MNARTSPPPSKLNILVDWRKKKRYSNKTPAFKIFILSEKKLAMWSQEFETLNKDGLEVGDPFNPFDIEVVGELGSSTTITVTNRQMTIREIKQAYCQEVSKHQQLK